MNSRNPFDLAVENPVVLGTGLIALDVVINGGEDQPPRLWAGGTCGNVLAILSYLGWRAFPVARLNGDAASALVQEDLSRWGVFLNFASSRPYSGTPIVVQRIRRNTAGISFHTFSRSCPNCGAPLPHYKAVLLPAARDVAARIEDPKVFFLDRVSPGALILAKASAEKGAIIVFEPSGIGDPRLFREALEVAHVLKYSHERMRQLDEMWLTTGPLLEIETLGRAGLRYRSKIKLCRTSSWQQFDAYEVSQIKDAAGAGDWCTAGIVHALGQKGLKGLQNVTPVQLKNALCFGQALAAWNCRFEGARGGMYKVDRKKFQSEVEQIMSGNGSKVPVADDLDQALKDVFKGICRACGDIQRLAQLPQRRENSITYSRRIYQL